MPELDLKAERITWLDLESTGLDPHNGEKLLQVAAIVTDGHFNEVSDEFAVKIFHPEDEVREMRSNADPFVRDMHDATGLWNSLSKDGEPLLVAEIMLLEFLKLHTMPGKARLGGNSITLDRNFLSVFMARVLAHLHYRSIDMTSVAGFFELTQPEIPYFKKVKSHDALDDIRESLAEARYYADHLKNFTH